MVLIVVSWAKIANSQKYFLDKFLYIFEDVSIGHFDLIKISEDALDCIPQLVVDVIFHNFFIIKIRLLEEIDELLEVIHSNFSFRLGRKKIL